LDDGQEAERQQNEIRVLLKDPSTLSAEKVSSKRWDAPGGKLFLSAQTKVALMHQGGPCDEPNRARHFFSFWGSCAAKVTEAAE
jgi:hypothetical protein